jgi:flavin reductase (DIM6/NTAB) family NADH-FMN oxidoreductase RutF
MQLLEAKAFREAMGLFATGVAVVSTGRPVPTGTGVQAMTVNSITGLSLEPLQLLFCPAKRARLAAPLQVGAHFCVNFLRQEQLALAEHFAGRGRAAALEPQFLPLAGSMRLAGCLASLACVVRSRFDGGDHWIVVGEVEALERGDAPHEPLVFFHGRFSGVHSPVR